MKGTLRFRDENDTPSTLTALERLKANDVHAQAASDLEKAYLFFRRADQFLRLLDTTSNGCLRVGTQSAFRVARLMRFRDRDGVTAERAMLRTWQEIAQRVRTHF